MNKLIEEKEILNKALELLGGLMTFGGAIWFITGDFTNGLLLMILGELVGMPKIKDLKKHE